MPLERHPKGYRVAVYSYRLNANGDLIVEYSGKLASADRSKNIAKLAMLITLNAEEPN